jgi:hypothetical protein
LNARPRRFQSHRLQKRDDLKVKFRIAFEDHVTVRVRFPERLHAVVRRSIGTRMRVRLDPAPGALDGKETAQQLQRQTSVR